ncbi:MAG: hypothetical protein A2Z72_06660 [Omnitrophica bacterium RBG_13_46_9]|nr:MAG: hypothetical protein A2Z72_06660 [Omnitrophica bacterium RBG_13_46_9]
MANKKENIQRDFKQILDQTKENLKKVGKELGILAQKSEEGIVKASKAGKIQLDIIGLNVQKEKLYYDIGKKLVSINAKKSLNIPELVPYFKKIRTISTDARKKKRELSMVRGKK